LIDKKRERERERESSLETYYCDALRNGPKFGIPTFSESCGVNYINISGMQNKDPLGLHHANHRLFLI
jgi:hypothetical protein